MNFENLVFHLLIWQPMSRKSLMEKRKCEQQFNDPLSGPPGVATSFISLQRKIIVVRGRWWLFVFDEQGQSHFHYLHLKVTNAPLICQVTWIWGGRGRSGRGVRCCVLSLINVQTWDAEGKKKSMFLMCSDKVRATDHDCVSVKIDIFFPSENCVYIFI